MLKSIFRSLFGCYKLWIMCLKVRRITVRGKRTSLFCLKKKFQIPLLLSDECYHVSGMCKTKYFSPHMINKFKRFVSTKVLTGVFTGCTVKYWKKIVQFPFFFVHSGRDVNFGRRFLQIGQAFYIYRCQ